MSASRSRRLEARAIIRSARRCERWAPRPSRPGVRGLEDQYGKAPGTLDKSQCGPAVVAHIERRGPSPLPVSPDPSRVRPQAFDRTGDIAPGLSRGALTLLCAPGKFAGDIHRLGTEPPDHFPRDVFNIVICHHQSSKKTGAFTGAEVWGDCYRYVESSRNNEIDQDGSGQMGQRLLRFEE